jgi:hypothetical protein
MTQLRLSRANLERTSHAALNDLSGRLRANSPGAVRMQRAERDSARLRCGLRGAGGFFACDDVRGVSNSLFLCSFGDLALHLGGFARYGEPPANADPRCVLARFKCRGEGVGHVRAKKPAKGGKPHVEDEDNEELVWARLREHASADDSRTPVTSEVVARSHSVEDPYSSYANFAQQEASESYVQGADEDEDDPAIWERLRANASQEGPRTSDVAPRGSYEAWEAQDAGQGYAPQADYYAEQEAQYAQEQQYAQQHAGEAEHYAQQQAEAEHYAQQQAEAEHYAQQQAEAEHYAQQQAEAEYYAQQQAQQQYAQQAQYAQQQQAQYAQQQQAQQYAQQQYAQPFQPAPSFVHAGGSPYVTVPAVAGYAAQPNWQQQPSHTILDDTYDTPRRGGALKWFGLLVIGGGLAAGGAVAYPRVMQQLKPAQFAPAAISALPLAASAPATLGADEARARDALFGTNTAPAAAAASPTPAPAEPAAAAAPEPTPAAAPEPAAPTPAPAAAAPEPAEQKFSALTGGLTGGKKEKAGKKAKGKAAKRAAKLAAAAPKRSQAPAAPRPKRTRGGGPNLAGGENSNDPLMGI